MRFDRIIKLNNIYLYQLIQVSGFIYSRTIGFANLSRDIDYNSVCDRAISFHSNFCVKLQLNVRVELHDKGADCFKYDERLIFFYLGLD